MIKMITEKTTNKKGFTLIELIVVIAILGILAAIAIPRFSAVQTNAEKRALEADARVLTSAAQLYAADTSANGGNGSYPAAGTGAAPAPVKTPATTLQTAKYIDKLPSDTNLSKLSYDATTGIFSVTTP